MAITSAIPPAQRGFVECGQDVAFNFTMYPAISIVGWTFLFEFLDTSGNIIFSKTNGSGITITNSTLGIIQVQLNSIDTILLPPANYNSFVHRIDTGYLTPLAKVVFYLRPSTYE